MVGRTVLLAFADAARPTRLAELVRLAPVLRDAGAVAVVVAEGRSPVPPGLCVAELSDAATAYIEVSGLATEALVGAEFLIDPARYLRRVWLPADDPAAMSAASLLERIRQLRLAPVARGGVGSHIH